LKKPVIIAAASAIAVVVTLLLLPSGSAGDQGTPLAIVFQGAVLGLLNGLLAAGIVLIYRSVRVINFAQGALGSLGGAFTFYLIQLNNWPYWLAFLTGIIVSIGLGLIVELGIIRRFFYAPRLAVTVLTIAIAGALAGVGGFVLSLPIFPQDISPQSLTTELKLPFPNYDFQIGDLPIPFNFGHWFAIGMTTLALVGLGLFLRFTRLGIAVRASAENAERAELLGINVRILSTVVWTIAAALAGLGVILTGSVTRFSNVSGLAPAALIPALAAAVVARMRNFPVAVVAALAVTVLRQAVQFGMRDHSALVDVGLLVVIVLSLLLQRRELDRSGAGDTLSWRATEEIRPTPKELLQVTGLRVWRWVLIGAVAAFLLILPWITSPGSTNFAGFIMIYAIVLLSLVVLTGWAGQVSLGQYGFVAIGAVLGGALTSKVGIPFWFVLPLAALFTAGVAVLIGIPALRIKGLFLAVATFAFAFAVQSALFNEKYFGWLLPQQIQRPTLFFLDFEDEKSMYYLSITALGAAIAVVSAMRRFRTGRMLIALRENEANLETFGVAVVKAKLAAFALSGFLSGFAGVLLAHHQRAATVASFQAQQSLEVFLLAVVGGISSVSGTILATAYFSIRRLVTGEFFAFLIGPFGILLILYLFPGGLASMAYGLRDSVYRIIAQRRQLIVPSLIADYNPDTATRRLVPLGQRSQSAGLALISDPNRYLPNSTLYGFQGTMSAGNGKTADYVRREEGAAISDAADALESAGENP
jgi:branched-chain amino acid transport system permease protein